MSKLIAVVRLRGRVGVLSDIKNTLKMLRLHKTNHVTLVEDTPDYKGMLSKVAGYVTYGEVDKETLALLLKKRGRLRGDKLLDDEYAKKLGFNGLDDLAAALSEGKIKLKDLPGLKPVFRLHPPSGGFKKSLKKPVGTDGELGYRGSKINELLKRML
ncbi:MAG: 50S ribosomal protein L30 [Candidatus Nezhaarchaeota archaeon]|nr:50S ribosomal protein L30 [Candidatus Nezhaarchaeota archaeon]